MKKPAEQLSEPVYQYLSDMILSLSIKPGERIPEAKIAEHFGISRTPIREALRRLSNDGIVTIYPNRYAEVTSYDDATIKQIGVVRIALDIMAAKLAIFNGSNAEFLEMKNIALQCYDAAKQNDFANRIKFDCGFHLEMGKISKNQQLIAFQKELYLKIEFVQACRFTTMLDSDDQFKEHGQIIQYLITRDEYSLIHCLAKHFGSFHNVIDDFPEDFFTGIYKIDNDL